MYRLIMSDRLIKILKLINLKMCAEINIDWTWICVSTTMTFSVARFFFSFFFLFFFIVKYAHFGIRENFKLNEAESNFICEKKPGTYTACVYLHKCAELYVGHTKSHALRSSQIINFPSSSFISIAHRYYAYIAI